MKKKYFPIVLVLMMSMLLGGCSGITTPISTTDANFNVQYPEGYEIDASNMLVWANQVVSTLQKSFPDFLDAIDSRILIVIKDTGDPSLASADIGNTLITFVAPSVAAEESDYYDENYYIGNIAHELGHIYLDRVRNLSGGYLRSLNNNLPKNYIKWESLNCD